MNSMYPAKFSKRLLAYVIDLAILYVVGAIIYYAVGSSLMPFGKYKLLVGIFISTLYFTYFNSYLGKGQTIGKKITNIRVMGADEILASVPSTLLRSLIFTIPYCLTEFEIKKIGDNLSLIDVITLSVMPILLIIDHVYRFTNKARMAYHDDLASTIVVGDVVNEIESVSIEKSSKNFIKFIPLVAMFVFFGIHMFLFNPLDSQNAKDRAELESIENMVKQDSKVQFSKCYYSFDKKQDNAKSLVIECYPFSNDNEMTDEIYLLTEKLYPVKEKYQLKKIQLRVNEDFNIGIFKFWETIRKNGKLMRFDL